LLGANRWIAAERYPLDEVEPETLYLRSDGLANLRGHGSLTQTPPAAREPPDSFQTDPDLPFVAVGANLDPTLLFDLRERERQEDTLVYATTPLPQAICLLGEFEVELFVSADTPDCDVVCWLAAAGPGLPAKKLSQGMLRLRYRDGFDRETPLVPDEPVRISIAMDYLSYEIPAGYELRLLIAGSWFPLIDPNPNTGAPIFSDAETKISTQTVFHDRVRPSRVLLPVLKKLSSATQDERASQR
jgi:putative CocE/NonD family hydrolase